jgi:hypothetical protein
MMQSKIGICGHAECGAAPDLEMGTPKKKQKGNKKRRVE